MSKRSLSTCVENLAPLFNTNAKIAKLSVESKVAKPDEERSWKILSWNVAGLRGMTKKDTHKPILEERADIIFMSVSCPSHALYPPTCYIIGGRSEQERAERVAGPNGRLRGYNKVLAVSTEKNGGYAGVALLSKEKPLKIWKGIGDLEFDKEGRLIIAEFSNFFFVGAYVPNSSRGLVNLDKRERWETLFLTKLTELNAKKPVIYGGDLNVAHNEIDLKNPASNRNKTAGFTDQERGWFSAVLATGFKDTFRELHAEEHKYSFWSYMGGARAKNVGWRLDYYLVSERIMSKVKSSDILTDIMGSDHAPIVLNITI